MHTLWLRPILGLWLVSTALMGQPASLLLKNAKIHSLNKAQPQADALAIADGRIVAIGRLSELKGWQGPATEVIDLQGKAVYPGFHEGHGHLHGLGLQLLRLDLIGLRSLALVQEKVKAALARAAKDDWLLGRGWDQNLWSQKDFPRRQDLDRLGASQPIALTRVDGHALWVNSAALQRAGITRKTADPAGGRILRDEQGEPSGILLDRAKELVLAKIPEESVQQREQAITLALQRCVEQGITTFHDAGVGSEDLAVYEALLAKGALPLRLNVMLSGSEEPLLERFMRSGPLVKGEQQLQVRAVKLMADGALGSRGAALLEPYSDQPSNSGLEILSEEQIYKATRRFAQAGFQTATHAIGDRSNRSVLNAYERVIKEMPKADLRLRVEHAQILDAHDIPRFGQLGIIASMQPTHLTSDAPWVPERIGMERMIEGGYVWQKLRQSKALLVSGSDTPVESVNPFFGLYAAVTRQAQNQLPPQGWSYDQHLSLDEALESYTRNAAYAAFWEKDLGSLEVGKRADLVVLDQDLGAIMREKRPQDLLKTRVLLTMVNGRIVYQSRPAGLRG